MTINQAISLCELPIGESATILKVEGGIGFIGRMVALGFTPGTIVHVDRNHKHGPILVTVLNTQIALGRGQALKIKVRRSG